MSRATDAIARADRALRQLREAVASSEVEHDPEAHDARRREHTKLALRAERLLDEALREVKREQRR